MSTIQQLEKELQAKQKAAAAAAQLAQEASRAESEAIAIQQQIDRLKQQEKTAEHRESQSEKMAQFEAVASEVNDLAIALKAKLCEAEELGAQINELGQIIARGSHPLINFEGVQQGELPLAWFSGAVWILKPMRAFKGDQVWRGKNMELWEKIS